MGAETSRVLGEWTRREFMRGAAGVVGLRHMPLEPQRFAYVASRESLIHVFSVQGERWTETQKIVSRSPAFVVLHPTQRALYVANDVDEHEGCSSGTVEVFRIDAADGRLTLLERRALSLSATGPRHLAVSPDGKLLAVAAYDGGAYNVFPITADGRLGPVSGIFKDIGSGADPELQASAHPHSLAFDVDGGHLLASDFGSDRLSVFALEEGGLRRRMQRTAGGPGAFVFHPAGEVLYVSHGLEGRLVVYPYNRATRAVGEAMQQISLPECSLAVHPCGSTLYASDAKQRSVRAWPIDAHTGQLLRGQAVAMGNAVPTQITVAQDGQSVFVLDGVGGAIYRLGVDRPTGRLGGKQKAAVVSQPASMAFFSL